MQIYLMDLLIQNAIDSPSDLAANLFGETANSTQNAMDMHSDLAAN
jgi:hypothetical protein